MRAVALLERAAHLANNREPFVLATVTWVRGPASGKVGSKAIIHPGGRLEGWLGGACATPTVVRYAQDALGDGQSRTLVLGRGHQRDDAQEVAMACDSEGAMEVFMEPFLPGPALMVVGGTPMTHMLETLARTIGWEVHVGTDPEHVRGAGVGTYIVVATQGHYDEPVLEEALGTPACYIGLVSSHKRARTVLGRLQEQGFSQESLERIKAPAGIDLGATAHEEIAVSILAQLVQTKTAEGPPSPPSAESPSFVRDPVCGMEVDASSLMFVVGEGDDQVHFCAAGCRSIYLAGPTSS